MNPIKIYPRIEGKFVCLERDTRSLGCIDPSTLNADANSVLDSYRKITEKYDLTPDRILEIVKTSAIQGRMMDFGGELLSFFYWCDFAEKAAVAGVRNLVRSTFKARSYDMALSNIFVAEIAAKYAKGHVVELKVKKKENGCDLLIDSLKCECKIRLGYLDPRNKRLVLLDTEEKSFDNLAESEKRSILRDRAVEAFVQQDADVVFVDATRTPLGFLHMVQQSLNVEGQTSTPPMLKKNMIIFHSRYDADIWAFAQLESDEPKTGKP